MAETSPRATSADMDDNCIPGGRLWVNAVQRPQYDVVIASNESAAEWCKTTLTWLRKLSVDMSRVHAFVDYEARTACGERTCNTYVRTGRARGFAAVHVRPGGKRTAEEHASHQNAVQHRNVLHHHECQGHRCLELTTSGSKADMLKHIPVGSLPSLWHHGHELL